MPAPFYIFIQNFHPLLQNIIKLKKKKEESNNLLMTITNCKMSNVNITI